VSRNHARTIDSFQSNVAAIREAREPWATQITVHVLAALMVIAVLILVVAKVDRNVESTSGKISSTVVPTIFQALDDASIVRSMDVREGERVRKGQVLATLDPTFTQADVSQLEAQIASLDQQIERASAELAGRGPNFSDAPDSNHRLYGDVQRTLYVQRSAQYRAQINSFDQKVAQTEATIQKYANDEKRYQEEEEIAQKIEDMRNILSEHGSGSLLNLLTAKASKVEDLRTAEFDHNSLLEAEHQLTSLKADRETFIQQWAAATSQELVTAQNSRDSAIAQLSKATKHRELVRLVADVDAIVLTASKLSTGSVLKAGDPVVTTVPLNAPLVADITVSTSDVGFIRQGDKATLKVDAFNYAEHGTAEGTVQWISEGAFSFSDDTNQPTAPYYRVRILINEMHFINVPESFRLIPGMTLSAEIHVGRRSLGLYLLEGLIRGADSAMREP
jgi:hemolysin D